MSGWPAAPAEPLDEAGIVSGGAPGSLVGNV